MEKSIIQCVGRVEATDKNGNTYYRVFFQNWEFSEHFDPTTGEKVYIREHSVIGHINQYEVSYTSSKRPDPYWNIGVGDLITGQVVQRKVEPYKTEKGFVIDYYNAVVFGDSSQSDWEDKIRRAFDKAGFKLLPNTVHTSFVVVGNQHEEEESKEEPPNKILDTDEKNKLLEKMLSKGSVFDAKNPEQLDF